MLQGSFDAPITSVNGAGATVNAFASSAPKETANGETKEPVNGNSCCSKNSPSHSHSSSTASSISEPQEPRVGSCCSNKTATVVKGEPSSDSIFENPSDQTHQPTLENDTPFSSVFYDQYMSQAGVFTYPPTYGTVNNPLEPSMWRQNARPNDHVQPAAEPSSSLRDTNFNMLPPLSAKDTVHTCNCGDKCQCIGCAAHPYNDATQNYVRSAYTSMSEDLSSKEPYTNGSSSSSAKAIDVNGSRGSEAMTSPTANTPSSATSTNGDEQNLSAADFFFVNYSFPECGGDTESCPCGDDCQCIGCTIHNLPG